MKDFTFGDSHGGDADNEYDIKQPRYASFSADVNARRRYCFIPQEYTDDDFVTNDISKRGVEIVYLIERSVILIYAL